MTDKAISPLRRRLIEDMAIRRLSPKTQLHYIRHVKRFADFLGRSADKATVEDVHRYQLWLSSIGTTVPTVNVSATALRFFFKITLKRRDLAEEVVSTREPRRLPVVLSPEEVGRLLASARNIKHKALLSLAYATGLRASDAGYSDVRATGERALEVAETVSSNSMRTKPCWSNSQGIAGAVWSNS
jgi:integrase/recombinase XerD